MFLRQGVIGIAGDAYHFAIGINPGADTALCPTAEALRHGDGLLWILLPVCLRLRLRN
ncbi:Uncharacterised protein [Salmonella enterica subsp. enterica serovar Bovismorbificans]|uniref:Uncharacterized protein n=1 Tax=Salmonella enterica subsp. enterica serovar Bovismorbificans TaxID=58097 RepID=A0A655BLM7_SALET|nr:Uncharacterised protein [Salmonella enterica subsp. enterica serovar Bovismorbificans]CNT91603.1 Uncharacterised protein [Salmonella enterica subsp. enterica serovar Bovismorbificans]CNU44974.1 Uncharacterised protein [Salmonella enterica subsp. enterica serovar Bovismorbificans]